MSKTVYVDDSMPPTLGSGSRSLAVETPKLCEISSASTIDGVLVFPPFGSPQLISGLDADQNNSDINSLTDDLPSFLDILEGTWKRNPEVIDLTAEDNTEGALSNPKMSGDSGSHRTQAIQRPRLQPQR